MTIAERDGPQSSRQAKKKKRKSNHLVYSWLGSIPQSPARVQARGEAARLAARPLNHHRSPEAAGNRLSRVPLP